MLIMIWILDHFCVLGVTISSFHFAKNIKIEQEGKEWTIWCLWVSEEEECCGEDWLHRPKKTSPSALVSLIFLCVCKCKLKKLRDGCSILVQHILMVDALVKFEP